MNEDRHPQVTLICCSYNRAEALRRTVPAKLAMRSVDRLLFALDGSEDDSEQYLRNVALGDPRVTVVQFDHGGVQATRNRALAMVDTPWVVFLDDDDLTGREFAEELLRTAADLDAEIVGAPWINAGERSSHELAVELRKQPIETMSLRSHPSQFTSTAILTPFLFSSILARTSTIRDLAYDPRYRGNSWREETDLFLRAWERGIRVARTPRTYSWLEKRYSGGHDQSFTKVRTEFWVAVNEFRFMQRHASTLQSLESTWSNWPSEWARTVFPRIRSRIRGLVRKTLRR